MTCFCSRQSVGVSLDHAACLQESGGPWQNWGNGLKIQIDVKTRGGGGKNLSVNLTLSVQWVGMDGFPKACFQSLIWMTIQFMSDEFLTRITYQLIQVRPSLWQGILKLCRVSVNLETAMNSESESRVLPWSEARPRPSLALDWLKQ